MPLEILRYIDPLNDLAFKKIFGSDPNKDLLIAFLNEIFKGRKHIVDIVYNKNEHPGELKNEGGVIFDLTCTGDQGERFIIEIQRGKQENFKERATFYASRLISDQAPKGKRSDWKYQLTEVYLIAIMDDFTFQNVPNGKYLHNIRMCDVDTGELFYDKLGYTFIELCNFVKTEDELETDLDNWLYVLKNLSHMDQVPLNLQKPIFEKLFNIAEYSNLTKEEKMSYDRSLKYKWDNDNVREYGLKEAQRIGLKLGLEQGLEQGLERGLEQGLEQGLQKGLEQGLQQGVDIGVEKVAREMKNEGISPEQIEKYTQLSLLEIEKL